MSKKPRRPASKPKPQAEAPDEVLLAIPALASKTFWIGAGIAALTVVAYWAVRTNGFVSLDDEAYVSDNPMVRAGLSGAGFVWAFTTGHVANWHPLTWLSHMLDVSLFGVNAGAHHMVNLLLHVANTLLLFALLKQITGSIYRSAFVAALFALHPLHVESVAWLAERKDVLSTFFMMLTLIAYVKYARQKSAGQYILVITLFALGLLAKPMLVTLPFVMLLLDYWPLGRVTGQLSSNAAGARRPTLLLLEKLPLLALAAASSIATVIAQSGGGAVATTFSLPVATRLTNAFVAYFRYLFKTIWPVDLSAFYPYSRSMPVWQGVVAFAALVIATVVILRAARRRAYLGVGWLWFVGMLVPVIGFVQVGGQAMADRYTYVPLIGIFIMVAWGVPDLLSRLPARQTVLGAAAVAILAACTVVTRAQVATWHDSMTLWQHALDAVPGNARAHSAMGALLSGSGKAAEALPHLREAAAAEPDFPDNYTNLGAALAALGRTDEAIAQYRTELSINPRSSLAHANLGSALVRQGKNAEALPELEAAVRLDPSAPDSHVNLGVVLVALGRAPEAAAHFADAARLSPNAAATERRIGNALIEQGKAAEAIQAYQRALKINPDYAEAHGDLGFVLMATGRADEAAAHLTDAIRLNPNLGMAHQNLGFLLASNGRVEEAVPHFREAVRLQPDSEQAHAYLGMALAGLHQTQEALKQFQEVLRINPANDGAKRAVAQLGRGGGGQP